MQVRSGVLVRHLAASASVSKTPSSRLMLLILMAALHLAPDLVTPLNWEVLVLRLFFICSMPATASFRSSHLSHQHACYAGKIAPALLRKKDPDFVRPRLIAACVD